MKCVGVEEKWDGDKKELVKILRELSDDLELHHGNVLIADRVGTGVGIAGGLAIIGGLIAAPFTAGLSLGLTIGGAVAGGLGSAVSIGSNITDSVIETVQLKSIQQKCEQLQE